MAQPTDRTVTRQALDGLLAEAAAADAVLPPIADCERLERELRAAIRPLANKVRTRLDYLPPGSVDWNRHDRALIDTRNTLLGGLGAGLQSAARHVTELGRRVRELREIAGE